MSDFDTYRKAIERELTGFFPKGEATTLVGDDTTMSGDSASATASGCACADSAMASGGNPAQPETDDWLATYLGELPNAPWGHYDSFVEPIRDIIARGGKRWRAVLLLITAEAVGAGTAEGHGKPHNIQAPVFNQALPLVSLIECVHAGTLVVDDIEDQSDTRRGDVAVHVKYGQDIAINSGNFMYLAPLRIIEQYPPSVRLKLYEIYQRLLTRLHMGQGLDIYWHRNLEIIPTKEQYYEMTRLKTGSLARMAIEMGCVIGEVSGGAGGGERGTPTESNATQTTATYLQNLLGEIADLAGMAFQVQDDILNITAGIAGKDFGDDLVEGKKSLPLLLAVQHKPEITEELTTFIIKVQNSSGAGRAATIKQAISLIQEAGGVELAEQELVDIRKILAGKLVELAMRGVATEGLEQFFAELLG